MMIRNIDYMLFAYFGYHGVYTEKMHIKTLHIRVLNWISEFESGLIYIPVLR